MTATVAWISIAPVKGMRMQDLTEVELGPDGAAGDLEFFLVNEKNDLLSVSRIGPLLEIVPEYEPGSAAKLTLNFPDGSTVASGVEAGEPEDVTFYGEALQARPVLGELSEAISRHCDLDLRLMLKPEGRPAVDRGAISGATILGLESLRRLETAAAEAGQPGPIDQRRFRMTFGIEGIAAHEEDEWIDGLVSIGEAQVRVEERVGRCAATTRDPDRGNVDLKTLHHIRSYRKDVISEEPLPFGVYGSVQRPGHVRIGDPVNF